MEKDLVLDMLVFLAEREPSISVNVTVSVGGTIISGTVISAKEYVSRLGSRFTAAIDGLDGDKAIELASQFDTKMTGPAKDGFLHLRDATVHAQTPIETRDHPCRIRLDAIQALVVGEPTQQA